MLFELLDLLKSVSVVVNGGLGGAARAPVEGYRRSGVLLPRCSLPRSVGSGVYNDKRGLTTFSRLPTASLLCFVENFGYTAAEDASEPDGRRSISGTMDILRLDDVVDDCELGGRRSPFGDLSLSLPFSFLAVVDAFLLVVGLSFSFSFSTRGLVVPFSLSLCLLTLRSRRSSSILRREVTLVPDKPNIASADGR
jgi:hypothetical protein